LTYEFYFKTCSVETSPIPVFNRAYVLTLRSQGNVIINSMGRALLTEYGLAPITFGPSFTTVATPDAVGNSRWLAPEIINPRKRGSALVLESKAADVFAWAMFVLEVYTGKIPFDQQRSEAVVLYISQGGVPEMPANAQELGLTGEMWKLLEWCWHKDPKKRPTMKKVRKMWQKFVEDDVIAGCVQLTFLILTSSNFYNWFRGPLPVEEPGMSSNRPQVAVVPPRKRSLQQPGKSVFTWGHRSKVLMPVSVIAPNRRNGPFCGLF
jgi:hypothetical protein